ncbi:hypothetical protein T552_00965 [Pneumocystis carinii B80]|uniref:GOLD domain-containing protein n=1 Tax=Pneumocystis carinii (strain B80) TaxID=1408658 RepID=A0A0W4ZN07_PNEC8|nr:hypothetical protein T552_00965 [Pneumocystis carinii B80]KTW29758.1 hypothetical protein T552_00965 [Pneumocystis carinii B80]
MQWFFLLIAFITLVKVSSLTIQLSPNKKQCFYTFVDEVGKKVIFYFAVRSGGSFDINYQIFDTNKNIIFNGVKEKLGDIEFMAKYKGEYMFCFSNEMSTLTDKILDFQVSVENEERAVLPESGNNINEQTGTLDEYLIRISRVFSAIRHSQKYLNLRENRNLSTVQSTESRIFWFSITESILILVVSVLQVLILKTFFTSKTILRI